MTQREATGMAPLPVTVPEVYRPETISIATNVVGMLKGTGSSIVAAVAGVDYFAPGSGVVATDIIWDAAGDLVQGTGANAGEKLTKGAEGTLLRAGASKNAYTTLTMPATIAAGSVFAANTANVLAAINSTSGTKYLKNASGTISWDTVAGTSALAIDDTLDATMTAVDIGFGVTGWDANNYIKSSYASTHSDARATLAINRIADGSGTVGNTHEDAGLWVHARKKDYLTTTVDGEVDGIYSVVYQGGGGDAAAILGAVEIVSSSAGGALGVETSVRRVTGATVDSCIECHIGWAEATTNTDIGISTEMWKGTGSCGIRVNCDNSIFGGSPAWTDVLRAQTTRDIATTYFRISGAGAVYMNNNTALWMKDIGGTARNAIYWSTDTAPGTLVIGTGAAHLGMYIETAYKVIEYGAADTGGTGYRMMRVVN